MYQNFIGIDIGKDSFYVAIHPQDDVKFYSNTRSGFAEFYKAHHKQLKKALVILECTGGYEMPLVRYLQKKKHFVHRANTRKVKHFIRSYGCLGKSDTIDARALATYGAERYKSLPLFVEHTNQDLLMMVNRRDDLKRMRVKEKNRLKAPEHKILKKSYKKIIMLLSKEIALLDAQIDEMIESDPLIAEKIKVLKSVTGIGDTIATALVVMMPELGKIDRKKIASLGGLAPHPNDSGKRTGYRCTRGGRTNIKPILYMAAMSVTRSHSELRDTYDAFIARGKLKMVALTAIMRKILVIANARLRDFYEEKTSAQSSNPAMT